MQCKCAQFAKNWKIAIAQKCLSTKIQGLSAFAKFWSIKLKLQTFGKWALRKVDLFRQKLFLKNKSLTANFFLNTLSIFLLELIGHQRLTGFSERIFDRLIFITCHFCTFVMEYVGYTLSHIFSTNTLIWTLCVLYLY